MQVGRQKAYFSAAYRHLLQHVRNRSYDVLGGLAIVMSRATLQARAETGGVGCQVRPPGEKVVARGTANSK